MKKTIKILSLLLILVMAASLVSCGAAVDGEGTVTVVIENEDGTFKTYETDLAEIDNKSEGAFGVLEALSGREEDPLTLVTDSGEFGKYIYKIGELENGKDGKYIFVYTSLEKDFDVSNFVKTAEYGGKMLKTSGLGVSSMSVESGTVLLFKLERYQ